MRLTTQGFPEILDVVLALLVRFVQGKDGSLLRRTLLGKLIQSLLAWLRQPPPPVPNGMDDYAGPAKPVF